MGTGDLKPMLSKNQQIQADQKTESVTVIREDGKEIVINTDKLAQHLDRGFKLKENVVKKVVKKVTKKEKKEEVE